MSQHEGLCVVQVNMPKKEPRTNKKTAEELANDENLLGSDFEDGSGSGLAETGKADNTENMENPSATDIIKAIQLFKQDFHIKMDGILTAIKNVQSDIKNCRGRATHIFLKAKKKPTHKLVVKN